MRAIPRALFGVILGGSAALLCASAVGCGGSEGTPSEAVKKDQEEASKATADFFKSHPPGKPSGKAR